jgi:hypothetical protein
VAAQLVASLSGTELHRVIRMGMMYAKNKVQTDTLYGLIMSAYLWSIWPYIMLLSHLNTLLSQPVTVIVIFTLQYIDLYVLLLFTFIHSLKDAFISSRWAGLSQWVVR